MNFIVDGMLGKLARWLRMMGHDAQYSKVSDDSELLATAKREHRILLTRDLALYQQACAKNIEACYVEGTTESERLADLAARFGILLDIDLERSRCPKCNTKLDLASKEEIACRVEKNTLEYYDIFWKCPGCQAVYWQGAHWVKIRATLEQANQKLKEKKIN
ncbi:MAG TPA: Mut7-C RNAse domain-containing protein [Candidatus Nanoarchaeia archaeon]|nr:Mut7-C RNAse domain-containing protein [Candidatus Nanoarchaeia archaeon]